MNLKFGKLFTFKFVGTGSSSYKKRIYRPAVSQSLRNNGVGDVNVRWDKGFPRTRGDTHFYSLIV